MTLSDEQLAFGRERMARQGLAERADLRLQDYRDIQRSDPAPFDAIASIEMFEAVGREYWGELLPHPARRSSSPAAAPASRASRSATTCSSATCARTDFIQQYIFPGGLLPSAERLPRRGRARPAWRWSTNSPSAPTTPRPCAAGALTSWRRDGQLRQLGFDTRFMRIWEFYLAYCEAAFATGNTNVVQFTLRRP